jgi:hypothetical protein
LEATTLLKATVLESSVSLPFFLVAMILVATVLIATILVEASIVEVPVLEATSIREAVAPVLLKAALWEVTFRLTSLETTIWKPTLWEALVSVWKYSLGLTGALVLAGFGVVQQFSLLGRVLRGVLRLVNCLLRFLCLALLALLHESLLQVCNKLCIE